LKRAVKMAVIASAALLVSAAWAAFAIEVQAPVMDTEIMKYLALAKEQTAAGAYGSAIRCYQRVIEIEDTAEHRLMLAEALMLNGDRKQCVKALNDLIDVHPDSLEAYEKLAECHNSAADYPECAETVKRAALAGLHSEKLDKLYYDSAFRYSVLDVRFDDAGTFINGFAVIKKDGYSWHINKKMRIIGSGYETADVFFGSTAAVTDHGEAYFIDQKGKKYLVPEKKCISAHSYSEGKAAIRWDDGSGFINIFGEPVLGRYLYTSSFQNGIAAVEDHYGWRIINHEGESITAERYDDVKLDEYNTPGYGGICFVKKNGSYRMMGPDGKMIGDMEFEDAKPFMKDQLTAVKLGGLWGFADRNGRMAIKAQYEDARPFSEGLAAVKHQGAWGFIDPSNVMVIDCIFEGAKCFSDNGMAPVEKDGYWTYIRLNE